jgi:hypothetical protein
MHQQWWRRRPVALGNDHAGVMHGMAHTGGDLAVILSISSSVQGAELLEMQKQNLVWRLRNT